MGDLLSTLSQPISAAAASAEDIAAIRSNSTKPNQSESTQQRHTLKSRTLSLGTSDTPTDSKTAGTHENPDETKTLSEKQSEGSVNDGDGGAEEEEEVAGECGFCLFMKAGGCKEAFIEWDNCMEAAGKNGEDVAEKCFKATTALKKCMEANLDYYAPILQAEKSMEEEAVKKLEEEKAEKSMEEEAVKKLEEEKAKFNVEGGGSSPESAEKEKERALGGNDSNKQS